MCVKMRAGSIWVVCGQPRQGPRIRKGYKKSMLYRKPKRTHVNGPHSTTGNFPMKVQVLKG